MGRRAIETEQSQGDYIRVLGNLSPKKNTKKRINGQRHGKRKNSASRGVWEKACRIKEQDTRDENKKTVHCLRDIGAQRLRP